MCGMARLVLSFLSRSRPPCQSFNKPLWISLTQSLSLSSPLCLPAHFSESVSCCRFLFTAPTLSHRFLSLSLSWFSFSLSLLQAAYQSTLIFSLSLSLSLPPLFLQTSMEAYRGLNPCVPVWNSNNRQNVSPFHFLDQ